MKKSRLYDATFLCFFSFKQASREFFFLFMKTVFFSLQDLQLLECERE